MKWLIASDIHGSAHYCRILAEKYKEEKADRMLLLGDLLYHGPRNDLPEGYNPKEVIDILNAMKDNILCIRGNCDSEVDQMVLGFPILADYAVFEIGGKIVYASHGHVYNENNMPPLHKGDIFLYGHTHAPRCEESGDHVFMNPGSVSMPKNESRNGYMIFENGSFIWKDLDGNILNEYKVTD